MHWHIDAQFGNAQIGDAQFGDAQIGDAQFARSRIFRFAAIDQSFVRLRG